LNLCLNPVKVLLLALNFEHNKDHSDPKETDVRRILLIAIGALCLIYLCDYLSVKYRIPKSREPFRIVTVKVFYAVPQKNGKTQFTSSGTEDQSCVNSLFPHFGMTPCWYLNRHKEKWINV